jgi:hypothetical protein
VNTVCVCILNPIIMIQIKVKLLRLKTSMDVLRWKETLAMLSFSIICRERIIFDFVWVPMQNIIWNILSKGRQFMQRFVGFLTDATKNMCTSTTFVADHHLLVR